MLRTIAELETIIKDLEAEVSDLVLLVERLDERIGQIEWEHGVRN